MFNSPNLMQSSTECLFLFPHAHFHRSRLIPAWNMFVCRFSSIVLQNGKDLPVTVQFAIEQSSGGKGSPVTPKIPLPESVLGCFPSESVRMPLLGFLKEWVSQFSVHSVFAVVWYCPKIRISPYSDLIMNLLKSDAEPIKWQILPRDRSGTVLVQTAR